MGWNNFSVANMRLTGASFRVRVLTMVMLSDYRPQAGAYERPNGQEKGEENGKVDSFQSKEITFRDGVV